MPTPHSLAVALLLFVLTGCGDGGQHTEAPGGSPRIGQAGQQRINQVEGADFNCSEQCGTEARSDVYSSCLADGGDRSVCGSRARVFYRDCLELQCTAEEILLDDCKAACRVEGAADREDCVEELEDEAACRTRSRQAVGECLSDCS